MKIFKILFLLIACSTCAVAQVNSADSTSRRLAETVANRILKKGTPYVIFCVNDKRFILISNKNMVLEEYFIVMTDSNQILVKSRVLLKKNKKLPREIMFNYNLYSDDYITFESDFYKKGYKDVQGGMTYFVINDGQGKGYGGD